MNSYEMRFSLYGKWELIVTSFTSGVQLLNKLRELTQLLANGMVWNKRTPTARSKLLGVFAMWRLRLCCCFEQ